MNLRHLAVPDCRDELVYLSVMQNESLYFCSVLIFTYKFAYFIFSIIFVNLFLKGKYFYEILIIIKMIMYLGYG